METRYYIIATLVTLILILLMLSACARHKYTTPSGIQVELPHTPSDKKGGTK